MKATNTALGGDAWSDDSLAHAYEQILVACRGVGLSRQDAEDAAQEVWLWLFRREPASRISEAAWLAVVARHFARRSRRRRARSRERTSLEELPLKRFAQEPEKIEQRLWLDEIERALPPLEAKLLRQIRMGVTLAEAARRLKIPPGSHDFHFRRLVGHARAGLRPTSPSRPVLS